MASLLSLKNISKTFGAVHANSGVSFEVEEGSTHGVVGENGAGKSTIMKIVYGLYQKDSGQILYKGQEVPIRSPQDALKLGIGMVQQHFTFVPTLTVWENVVLGNEPTLGKLPKKALLKEIDAIQKNFGFSLNLESKVENLPVGLQQQVEILKILYQKANLLIFDEPTAVLTPQEVKTLFERLRQLNADGKTIVIITHKLKEILDFTKSVTVMRQGKVVETKPTSEYTQSRLAEAIIGRKQVSLPARSVFKSESPTLEVKELCYSPKTGSVLSNLTFSIKPGEILGIAGIEGNGQRELCEILSNVERNYSGEVRYLGKPLNTYKTYPVKQEGLSVIPPDRHHEGVILDFTVEENAILGHHKEKAIAHGFRLSFSKREALTRDILKQFDVRPADGTLPMYSLSGGNQQKLVVGRETHGAPKFLIAAHPTRGVDIGAIEFIHTHFLKLRSEGCAILLISSELDEVLALSDRILVLFRGKIVGETTPQKATESQLGLWMTGGSA